MKIRTKIYLSQLVYAIVITSFLLVIYNTYEKHYLKDVDEYVEHIAKLKKKEFLASLSFLGLIVDDKRADFYDLHKEALSLIQQNPLLPLADVKKTLKKKHHLKHINIELYLVNKKLVIFDTTYEKDRGFDLSIIPDTQYYIDQVNSDNEIHFVDQLSFDPLDNYYKQYSFSKVKKDLYLEVGFIDNNLNKNIDKVFVEESNSKYISRFYRISDIHNYQVLYRLEIQKSKVKQNFFDTLERFYLDKESHNPIINSVRTKGPIKIKENGVVKVITPILNYKKVSKLDNGFIIMEIDIDINAKLEQLNDVKTIFFFIVLFVLLFLGGGFFWIKRNFTEATDTIVDNISHFSPIANKALLEKENEFGVIANKYNSLLHSLKEEVETNKILLSRNKQFIADTVHQIRTPLSVIMMNTDMIKISQSNRTNTDDYIEQINASINMLTNSYEDLSYIISYDTIEYKATNNVLSNILKERVEFFSTISRVNSKPLVTNIEEDLSFMINQIEIERLIDNNISNAIKYATIDKPIQIDLFKSNGYIQLLFFSFGKEIKNKSLLFEKSYRENEEKRGLGLGLSMVKDICFKYYISYSVEYRNNQNIFTYQFKI